MRSRDRGAEHARGRAPRTSAARAAGCVCTCGIECKQGVRVCSCTAAPAAKVRAGHGVPCARAWYWLQPGARGCGWSASDQAAARAVSSMLSRHFGGNAPAHGSTHHVSCSGAEGTNTMGWVRTRSGSAQGPAVSCDDVVFSAKSCICAHGRKNLASPAVCTRALRCEVVTPMRIWWWCRCRYWCLCWSKVFVLMPLPPQ